ncbi:golgin candidate 4 isoform X2 [Macadamia integrifolia]|uniref:golgin candidate 4 isoform X2 n=1 Tax=Macadamia integrifolia TaxID=60698 RepID=UPI001C53351D|nr:golgin candidate 4 isoform X2 [Macadamia integrifolia]
MWSSIANLKENLNQMALDVQDAAEELEIFRTSTGEDSSLSDRRISHRFAQSKSPMRSPIPNGVDSGFQNEIEKYRAEVQRLQASESEIKALSVNYAALLKEKEEQLSRLQEENGSLRQTVEATNAGQYASRNGSPKMLTNNPDVLKGMGDQSPSRQYRIATQANNRSTGNRTHKGTVFTQESLSNGSVQSLQPNGIDYEKELADLLEEKSRSLTLLQANHESEIKRLLVELDKERDNLAKMQLKLEEEHKLNESFQTEVQTSKMDKDKDSMEMKELRNELSAKISEIRQLQLVLNRRDRDKEVDETAESLKGEIAALQKENTNLKLKKDELEAALKTSGKSSPDKKISDGPDSSNKHSNNLDQSSGHFPRKEEMELSLQKFGKDLKEVRRERDKALQELNRLKQHLLDKELEESEKMDEDSKIIEDLRANSEYQRAQISHLENTLKQAMASQEEVKKMNQNELQKARETISDLKQKLASYTNTIDAKNVELSNLQTALGQYYAESEAKDRLERGLALAREESAKLSELLKDANQRVEISKQEKEEIVAKLSQAERMISEGKRTTQKLEEDNIKLRRALEQSMTRLNRMSMDSDYFVDRRIVIKLLVTYFQRNHSKEVLDLMVRMLGFSEEDKQRIGVAHQGAGKGVVRGVLGLPGRLVGGILGGGSPESHSHVPSENQSFADLWVDFLLKETEERERREAAEATAVSKDSPWRSPISTGSAGAVLDHRTSAANAASGFSRGHRFQGQDPSPSTSRGNMLQLEHSETEFSTVPLTSSVSSPSEKGF